VFDPEKYVWHFTPGLCGPSFALFDLGVHWLDLPEFVTGSAVVEVSAAFATRHPVRTWRGAEGHGPRPVGANPESASVPVEVTLEDHADLLVRFANGAKGAATVMALSPGNPNALTLAVDGSAGGFDWAQSASATPIVWRPPTAGPRSRRAATRTATSTPFAT
jgi:predicted dehydrogenase